MASCWCSDRSRFVGHIAYCNNAPSTRDQSNTPPPTTDRRRCGTSYGENSPSTENRQNIVKINLICGGLVADTDKSETVDTVPVVAAEQEQALDSSRYEQAAITTTGDLYQFARFGDVEELRSLLENPRRRRNVNERDADGESALHYAARFDQYEAVVLLVETGNADVSIQDNSGATPLHYAARKKQSTHSDSTVNIIHYLAKSGADVNAADKFRSTPLHFAAMRGNEVVTLALLQCDHIEKNAKDHLGATPLHEAVKCDHLIVARMLIENGCDVMMTDDEGTLPFHLACLEGNITLLRLLLADVQPEEVPLVINKTDFKGNAALHIAVESRYPTLVEELLIRGADVNKTCRKDTTGCTPLHLAAISGDVEIARMLLRRGARPEVADQQRAVPLHKAAEYRSTEVATLLLENGCRTELRDVMWNTPFLVACCQDNSEIVKVLLDYDASVRASDGHERTALFLAVENDQNDVVKIGLEIPHYTRRPLRGNHAVVKELLAAKPNIQSKNENERSAFQLAALSGHARVCETLLRKSKGKCLNDRDEDSNTALHLAAAARHVDVVRLLIAQGADKEAKNCISWTPLDVAVSVGDVETVEYLLNQKVPVDTPDREKLTGLHLASKNGHLAVVRLLLERGADVTRLDRCGENAIDMAIGRHNVDVAGAIVKSDSWQAALKNETTDESKGLRTTPLRKMVEKMPEIAALVFDRCITVAQGNFRVDDPAFWIEFNYEYIDDTYASWDDDDQLDIKDEPYDVDGTLRNCARAYSNQSGTLKTNHILQMIVDRKRDELITHPLVLALVRRKWRLANYFYLSFLLLYAIFVGLLSAYLVAAQPPFAVNMTECNTLTSKVHQSTFERDVSVVIILVALIGIANEVFQIATTRVKYFTRWLNLIDWFTYISAIIIVSDITACGVRTAWQWQLGVITNFVAWMDLILLLRSFPVFGVYAVMITKILRTFLKFFVMFFMFIVAFGLNFYLLLNNQENFRTPQFSVVKMAVYMLGEMDYAATFHSPGGAYVDTVFYQLTTYALLIAYLVLMSIVVLNLLTALAVDDVNKLREFAKLERIAMQIDLCLDVEVAMPAWLARWRHPVVARERWYPYKEETRRRRLSWWWWDKLTEGPSRELIVSLISGTNKQVDKGGDDQYSQMIIEHGLTKQIESSRRHMNTIHAKLDRIEHLLNSQAASHPVRRKWKREMLYRTATRKRMT
ncbi:ANK_REP_REGION domain-containing protein [Lamellibrachia satsuma]|nr:ANK_REP_REGION domain-containing protein [Lamellibrachia satsuma]